MAYFPMFIELCNKDCLVVGGGKIALRKIQVLLDYGASVSVIAPEACEEILALHEAKQIRYKARPFAESDAAERLLVVAATDDRDCNHGVAEVCKARNIPINVVDQKEDCTFIFPSYVKEGELVAAFSSGGRSPYLTQMLRDREKEILTPFLGELNDFLGSIRGMVKERIGNTKERAHVYEMLAAIAMEKRRMPLDTELEEIFAQTESIRQ